MPSPTCKQTPLPALRRVVALIATLGIAATSARAQDDAATDPSLGPEAAAVAPNEAPLVVGLAAYRDPLEPVNRVVFRFNDVANRYAIAPLGKGYQRAVPQGVRTGIRNVFANLKMPINAVNQLLQGRGKRAAGEVARFAVNTTVGIGGIFDPARSHFDLQPHPTGFADTLARYGVGYGAYLEIPLLGPSDLRSGTGSLFDFALSPVRYYIDSPERLAVTGFDYFQVYAPVADEYEELRSQSEDPYTFFRNLHLQNVARNAAYEQAD